MTNNTLLKSIDDYPLDSLILYSLREFSNGNIEIADKIHEIFQQKVKVSLKKAQTFSKKGNNYMADVILTNITRAKIAQAEWIYLATQKKKKEVQIDILNKNDLVLLNDIYSNLELTEENFKKIQSNKLKESFSKGNFEESRNRSKQLLVIFPKDVDYQNFYGLSQIKMGLNINAVKTFENALKFNPENPTLLLNMGIAQFKAGIVSHAELFVRKSLQIDSKRFESNKILGEILIKQNNYIEAEYYFLNAYKIRSDSSSVCANLSYSLLKQNKNKEALFYAKISCNLAPGNPKYINNLGLIYKINKLDSEAKREFINAIKILPSFYEAHNNLGIILQNSSPSEAIIHFKIAQQDNSLLEEIYINMSVTYRKMGNTYLSKKYASKSLIINPKNYKCYKLLGILCLDKGDFKNAIKNFEKTLELNPLEAETYKLIGKLKELGSNYIDKILGFLLDKKFQQNEEKHILFMLGEYFEKKKDFKQSWKFYKYANELIQKNIPYSILEEKKQFQKIKIIFNKFSSDNTYFEPSPKTIIFIIGMPRSGSSLIEQFISNNKNIYGGGEINLITRKIDSFLSNYNKNLHKLDYSEIFQNLRDDYIKYIESRTKKNIITDKMPHNFLYLGIIKLIFPKSKFIHISRNKLDNCFSLYKNYFSDNNHPYSYDLENILEYYKLYEKHMKYWKDVFPNCIYDIKYESLVSNTYREIRNLVSYCELKWDESYLKSHKNNRKVLTSSAYQIRNEINNKYINNWMNYSNYINSKKEIFKL